MRAQSPFPSVMSPTKLRTPLCNHQELAWKTLRTTCAISSARKKSQEFLAIANSAKPESSHQAGGSDVLDLSRLECRSGVWSLGRESRLAPRH